MKRIIALLIALVLFALPALAEPMDTFDYTDDILEDGSLIYYFPEISLRLPADWRGKVMALREESGTAFYQKASYDKYQAEGIDGGGFLFRLSASVNQSFTELPAYQFLGFSERSAMNYYLLLPSDYPAYPDDACRAEYDAMLAQIDYVADHAEVYPAQGDQVPAVEMDGTGYDAAEVEKAFEQEFAAGEADAAGETDSAGEADAPVSLSRIRYAFEHSVLPRYFYEVPENMLDAIGGIGLYTLWESYTTENGVDPTYSPDAYIAHWYASDDGATVVQVEMPAPEETPQCFRVYFIYNAAASVKAYYTVEYDAFTPDLGFVCTWTEDRQHMNIGGVEALDPAAADYADRLLAEAEQMAKLAGVTGALTVSGGAAPAAPAPEGHGLAVIPCPELGFTTAANPAYPWDYQAGTGITIYTQSEGSIPYVIVYQGEDLIVEAYEYIREQFTPHMRQKYGDDLVSYEEVEAYDVGGKQLPAGLYTYRVGEYLVDMVRVYDSTGARTVAYTAKYIQGEGEATLRALDDAVRGFRAQ